MIPYVEQPSFSIGPITVHAFGVIVATGVVVGDQILKRRVRAAGLDESVASGLGWYALVTGFLFAHLFALILYFPEKVLRNPLSLVRFWEDLSSFGGMLGGALGVYIFLKRRAAHLSPSERWAYVDAAAFALPFAWAIGRIACSIAHDHPGRVTSFPLAVSLSDPRAQAFIANVYAGAGLILPPQAELARLGFHDLGWYEFLYLAVVVIPLFMVLVRQPRSASARPGWWLAVFCIAYAPMRIALDILRVADRRYFGLTPGQIVAGLMLGFGVWLLLRPSRAGVGSAVDSVEARNGA